MDDKALNTVNPNGLEQRFMFGGSLHGTVREFLPLPAPITADDLIANGDRYATCNLAFTDGSFFRVMVLEPLTPSPQEVLKAIADMVFADASHG